MIELAIGLLCFAALVWWRFVVELREYRCSKAAFRYIKSATSGLIAYQAAMVPMIAAASTAVKAVREFEEAMAKVREVCGDE